MSTLTNETEAGPGQIPWRRWLLSWALLTFWLGLMPLVVVATYYGVKKPSDFDLALRLLRTEKLLWVLRVGSASCSTGVGIDSWSFGVNAENSGFEQARSEVWNGTLREADQATYLVWFRGAHWPAVFTVFRSVKPDGEISYGASQNGSKPIVRYLLSCLLFGGVAVVFLEVVRILEKRKKARGAS